MTLRISRYNKRAMIGGLIATSIIGLGSYLLGNLSGYEAKLLIRNSLPGVNVLCNTIVLASATILALLLTLLSLSGKDGQSEPLKTDKSEHSKLSTQNRFYCG